MGIGRFGFSILDIIFLRRKCFDVWVFRSLRCLVKIDWVARFWVREGRAFLVV